MNIHFRESTLSNFRLTIIMTDNIINAIKLMKLMKIFNFLSNIRNINLFRSFLFDKFY